MNIKLLRSIQKEINDTRYIDMDNYFRCGSPCCIAGYALGENYKDANSPTYEPDNIFKDAQKELGLTFTQATLLFLIGKWPDEFYEAYDKAFDQGGRAKVTSERIDHFIKTK